MGGKVSLSASFYSDWLDQLWGLFGAGRIIFGSDWPNCNLTAPFADTVQLSRDYLASKPLHEQEQVLFTNAKLVYRLSSV
ncbi:Amidohydrolase [compost metagenome]